jgi:hypothetical protein
MKTAFFLFTVLLISIPCIADTTAGTEAERWAVGMRDATLREALDAMVGGSSYSYRLEGVDSSVLDQRRIRNLYLVESIETILPAIVKCGDPRSSNIDSPLSATKTGSVFVISPQKEEDAPPPARSYTPVPRPAFAEKLTFEFVDVSMKQALHKLFSTVRGVSYAIDPRLDGIRVKDVKFVDQTFDEILEALTKSVDPPLAVRYEDRNGAFLVSLRKSAQHIPASAETVEVPKPRSPYVTIDLPSGRVTSVAHQIGPAWLFREGLTNSVTTPSAKFVNFPREAAARFLIASAGLVLPAKGVYRITERGAVDPVAVLKATPMPEKGAFSIAAWKSGEEWRYAVLANEAPLKEVLGAVLSTAGETFLLADDGSQTQGITRTTFGTNLRDTLAAVMKSTDLQWIRQPEPGSPYIVRKRGTGPK